MKFKHLFPEKNQNHSFQFSQINSLEELKDEFDESTLMVFDIDEVLITTEDHFNHPYAEKLLLSIMQQAISNAKTDDEKRELEKRLSLCILLPRRGVIEPNAPTIVSRMQQKGAKVIGLTSLPTGTFGLISQLERWRIEHLQSLNIKFTHDFFELERRIFETLQDEEKYDPLYDEGILFSPGYHKGDVLKEFLKTINWKPSKVIFVDDLVENIASVHDALKSMGIPFEGYQYLGAHRFFKELNEEVISYQISHLLDTKEWLSDLEVKSRIVQPFKALNYCQRDFFRASSDQPYHLSIGAVLFDQKGRIACHHFKEILGHKDIYILMRETMEAEETPLMTLARGLMEEFAAVAQPIAFLGCLSGPSIEKELSYEKTTLYFACQLTDWSPKLRNLQDTEGTSIIEWIEPDQLIALMERQGKRFNRVDADESEVIKRALAYIKSAVDAH